MQASSMIIEGFICPECQQDMSSVELLQAHFELVHLSNKNTSKRSSQQNSSNSNGTLSNETSGFSSVLAKAKTLITINQSNDNDQSDLDSNSPISPQASSSNFNSLTNPASALNQAQSSNTASGISYQFMKQYFNSNQNDGHFSSHTNDFKRYRDNTIGRYVIQTNKLLITLDKLINFDHQTCNDDAKREAHYKSIVSWVSDKDVNLCPNCAKSFNLIYRKHHCRLCGAIMCNKCSQFISFSLAKQLTDPDSLLKAHTNSTEEIEFKLKRSDSITSVNSYFFKSTQESKEKLNTKDKSPLNTDQTYLRLCFDCGRLLEKKYKSLKDKIIRPEFANLYDELHVHMIEAQRLYPVYTKMAESLCCGEALYQLGNAEDIRNKLIKLFQQIEIVSASIQKYGVEGTSTDGAIVSKISNDQFKLQRNIRFFAINYLREHSFNLPSVPSAQEYQKLKSQRQLYLIEEMKRTELEQNKQRKKLDDQAAKNRQQTAVKKQQSISVDNSNGWIPAIKPNFLVDETAESQNEINSQTEEEDGKSGEQNALRIQIQLVEAYLNDALKQKKFDEANILQQNLNELLTTLANSK